MNVAALQRYPIITLIDDVVSSGTNAIGVMAALRRAGSTQPGRLFSAAHLATGLRGCPELTEGVLLYVQGDTATATKKITAGAAQNTPEQIRAFARSLRQLRDIPGAESFMGPVLEVAQLLDAQEGPARRAAGGGASVAAVENPDQPVEPWTEAPRTGAPPSTAAPMSAAAPVPTACKPPADTDVEQIEAGVAVPGLDPARAPCATAFGEGVGYCLRVIAGPFVVTDLHVAPGCRNNLFATARSQDVTRWTIPGTAHGLTVHGARLPVRKGEALFIGTQAATAAKLSTDPRCAITWSGFRAALPEDNVM